MGKIFPQSGEEWFVVLWTNIPIRITLGAFYCFYLMEDIMTPWEIIKTDLSRLDCSAYHEIMRSVSEILAKYAKVLIPNSFPFCTPVLKSIKRITGQRKYPLVHGVRTDIQTIKTLWYTSRRSNNPNIIIDESRGCLNRQPLNLWRFGNSKGFMVRNYSLTKQHSLKPSPGASCTSYRIAIDLLHT